MKGKGHIKSFNEATENLNISDVSDSNEKLFSKKDMIDFAEWLRNPYNSFKFLESEILVKNFIDNLSS